MDIIDNFEEIIEVPQQGVKLKDEKIAHVDENVRPLISEGVIAARVRALACKLSQDHPADIYGAVILKGSMLFLADLIRAIYKVSGKQLLFDSIEANSYEKNLSTGEVKIKIEAANIRHKHVLVIDDIIDTGLTLHSLKNRLLQKEKVASIKICCLLDKLVRRTITVKPDYTGFIIPNLFVVGYGLDYKQRYRGLPYIGFLKDESLG